MEDWTRGHVVLAAGALINSALYLGAVGLAAYGMGYNVPLFLAIAAMGVTFLSYAWRLQYGSRRWVDGVALLSQGLGAAAGVVLLREVFL